MAKFTVSKNHTMPREAVRAAAEELALELKSEYGLDYRWQGDTATFSRSGMDGTLHIDGECVTVSVKLGLLASAFERPLRRAVTQYLEQHIS